MQKHVFGTLPHLAFTVWMVRTPTRIVLMRWNSPFAMCKATHPAPFAWNKAGTGKSRVVGLIGDVGIRHNRVSLVHVMVTSLTFARVTVVLPVVVARITLRANPSAPTGNVDCISPTWFALLANGEAIQPQAVTCLQSPFSWTATSNNFQKMKSQQSRKLGLPAGRIKSDNLPECPGR